MNFEKIVQGIVNMEAKASLKSSIIVWDSDARYLKRHRLSHNTSSKVQIKGSNYKNIPCSKESKSKDPKFALPCNITVEPAKKEGKKKKKSLEQKWKCNGGWKEQLLATEVNTEAPK